MLSPGQTTKRVGWYLVTHVHVWLPSIINSHSVVFISIKYPQSPTYIKQGDLTTIHNFIMVIKMKFFHVIQSMLSHHCPVYYHTYFSGVASLEIVGGGKGGSALGLSSAFSKVPSLCVISHNNSSGYRCCTSHSIITIEKLKSAFGAYWHIRPELISLSSAWSDECIATPPWIGCTVSQGYPQYYIILYTTVEKYCLAQ